MDESDIIAKLQAVYESLQEIDKTAAQRHHTACSEVALIAGFKTGTFSSRADHDSVHGDLNKLVLRTNKKLENYHKRLLFVDERSAQSSR